MGMVLSHEMTLLKEPSGVLLRRRRVANPDPVFLLHPIEAAVLALLDGVRNLAEVSDIIRKIFMISPEAAERVSARVVDRFWQFLVDREDLSNPNEIRICDLEELIYRPAPREASSRGAAPASLTLVITKSCPRRCLYCGTAAEYASAPVPGVLPLAKWKSIIDQAADVGVSRLELTGGEPFLRQDIFEVLEYVGRKRFRRIDLMTKYSLDEDSVVRLKGLKGLTVQVGLDSADRRTNDLLTGSKGSFDELVRSLELLAKHRVESQVITVVTRHNFQQLSILGVLLESVGAASVCFSECKRSLYRDCGSLSLDYSQREHAKREIAVIRSRGRFRNVASDFEEKNSGCSRGRTSLAILDDGAAAVCHGAAEKSDELRVGDLKIQSIMEVWLSPALKEIISPDRERFRGTACHGCSNLDSCNVRGRCFYQALYLNGKIFSSDQACPVVGCL